MTSFADVLILSLWFSDVRTLQQSACSSVDFQKTLTPILRTLRTSYRWRDLIKALQHHWKLYEDLGHAFCGNRECGLRLTEAHESPLVTRGLTNAFCIRCRVNFCVMCTLRRKQHCGNADCMNNRLPRITAIRWMEIINND